MDISNVPSPWPPTTTVQTVEGSPAYTHVLRACVFRVLNGSLVAAWAIAIARLAVEDARGPPHQGIQLGGYEIV